MTPQQIIPLGLGNVAEYNVFVLLVLVSTREREEGEEEIKKKEGGLRNTRGPGNRKRQEVGRCQPKQRKTAKRDGDTNLQAWDRLVYIQASCVEAFDVALTRKYLGRGNDVRGLPGPVISTPRRKRILFQLENRFSPVEIKRGKRRGEAKPPFSLLRGW